MQGGFIGVKVCSLCRKQKTKKHFYRVIKRRDYYIDCDEDGFNYYLKETEICLDCREILIQRSKKKYD